MADRYLDILQAGVANFGEPDTGEVPRILLLGTSVNKEGKGPHKVFPSMIRERQ
jgi:hypothetical protein